MFKTSSIKQIINIEQTKTYKTTHKLKF